MEVAPIKSQITFDDFKKLDIRVGTIQSVEDITNSKKLIRLKVDFGDKVRTILSGMKEERENFMELQGVQTLFILNLPERKIFGEVSEGMIFDLGWEDGINPALIVPEKPVPNGTRAG